MKILALIPARGGSKGVPRKNIATLGDRPLIAWTIDAARNAGCFDRVVVTTDDAEIAEISAARGALIPFLRPAEFSGDNASALGVISHALTHFEAVGEQFDAVAYLQPTSPFRRPSDLSRCHALYCEEHPDSLVSVVEVPHNMSFGSTMLPLGRSGEAIWLESPHGQIMRRQEKQKQYARNGPAILFVSRQDILQRDRIYGERVLGFEMDKLSSFDIDDPIDLEMARCLAPLARDRLNEAAE